jgi:hypothetical protein
VRKVANRRARDPEKLHAGQRGTHA